MHLSKASPYITLIPKECKSPLICYGRIPSSVLSQSFGFSLAAAPYFKGWFNREVSNSTPKALDIQHRAGLDTVHC